MTGNEAYRLENTYPVRSIESEAAGVYYFVDDDRRGVIIAGKMGMVGLTRNQALAVCRELGGVVEELL